MGVFNKKLKFDKYGLAVDKSKRFICEDKLFIVIYYIDKEMLPVAKIQIYQKKSNTIKNLINQLCLETDCRNRNYLNSIEFALSVNFANYHNILNEIPYSLIINNDFINSLLDSKAVDCSKSLVLAKEIRKIRTEKKKMINEIHQENEEKRNEINEIKKELGIEI